MKIIIIRENKNEKTVDLEFHYNQGTLSIDFSPDFLGEKVKVFEAEEVDVFKVIAD